MPDNRIDYNAISTAKPNSAGLIAGERDYSAFGVASGDLTVDQPYGFTGREHERESGLIYYRASPWMS